MTEPLLSVRDLSVTIGQGPRAVTAVDRVSFDVRPGEILGIVGESGSGKSVTLRSILGLGRQGRDIRGEILWQGADLLSMPADRIAKLRGGEISIIFQDAMTALNPVLTIGAQIRETLARHTRLTSAQRQARALELLGLVGIADPATRALAYPHQFSGGMRQRAMIAIALAAEPRLLLADEPTTALDVTIQDQILKLIQRLRHSLGMSVVLVTHDLGVVAQSCDRVCVMYAGRIVESGPVADIFRQPRHAYTLALLNSIPTGAKSQRTLQAIRGALPAPGLRPRGCIFAPRCDHVLAHCELTPPPLARIADDHFSACLREASLPRPMSSS